MNTIIIQSQRANTIDQAIKICEGYIPFMSECKDKRQMVIFTLMDNLDYCKAIIKNSNREWLSKGDLCHDLLGLSKKDEHFLPRIS